MSYTPLPIGIDDFEEIITKEYYYVDKTLLIKDLLDKKGKVNLFTRPRRFGKTLSLSMLKYYFEKPMNDKSNRNLFDGFKIMGAGEKYTSKMEQYPVITLTLKSAKQPTWEMAYASIKEDIAAEFERHGIILESDYLLDEDKHKFIAIRGRHAEPIDYAKSLVFLCKCLHQYYHQKVIILIDEYDVPLENAYYAGFYDQMIAFIRSLFESALKTNSFLEFAVITGCLRISKESIFTGLNNLKIISILNEEYDEYFGFSEDEVKRMLQYYGRESKMDTVKEWYDGYCFGNVEVYNPWSVINYTEKLFLNENAFPTAAWSNTSSNSIIKDLIFNASKDTKDEIESLVNGATIEKKVHEDMTYDDIYATEDNLWNFLFFTGYLKQTGMRMEGVNRYVTMAVPNNELLYIYENTIENWFREDIKKQNLDVLYRALLDGKENILSEEITKQLRRAISYMDNKETFYHGFLIGLFIGLDDYLVKSNREGGNGRYDILIRNYDETKPAIILELKIAKTFKELDAACDKALAQIEEKQYDAELVEDGYTETIRYGIGFFKKKCKVKIERKELEE